MYADGVVYAPLSRKEYAAQCREEADRILGAIAAKAKTASVPFTPVSAISSAPWEAILAAARKHKCDAIVMAADPPRHWLIANLLWSHEPHRVRRRAEVPVYLVVDAAN